MLDDIKRNLPKRTISETPLPNIPDKFKFTPEFRLLAACSWIAPPALEQEQAEKIAALCRGGIDWNQFVALVRRHGVSALAYTMLSRYAEDWLPDAIRETLKSHRIQVAGQALRQTAELVRISKLFAEQSIEMIVMKGVLLSQQLFGNPSLRESIDIDLLVPLEDFYRADQLIRTAGYRCTSPGSDLTDRQKQFHRSIGQNYEYVNASNGIALEIHWRSYLWSQGQTDILWKHRRSFEWEGVTFSTWEDNAQILSLCYHGAHHEWCSLKWLSDVAMLLSQNHLNGWERLPALADQLGMKRVLAQSALLVHWIYCIPLPGLFCALIQEEKKTVPLSATAIRAMVKSSGDLAAAGKRMDNFRHSWYLMQLIPKLPYLELLKSIVIKYTDFKEFPLPNSLFCLYVPLRPVFWFIRNYMSPRKNV